MIEDRVKLRNTISNYKISGGGYPLLILHGWGGSSNSWNSVREILSKSGFRILSPDFPGFGASEKPSFPWHLDDYADWVLEFLKYAGIEKCHFIGHSFGGRVSIKIAARHPEIIEKLILCDSAGVKMKTGVFANIIILLSELGNLVLSSKYLTVVKDFFRGVIYYLIKNRDYVKADGLMKEIMKKVLKEDLSLLLPQIKSPALIIWGENDKIVPVKYAKVFNDNIAGSELIVLPKIGHSPHLEDPPGLAKIIDNFLKK